MLALLRKDAQGRVPAKSRELLHTLRIMAQHEDPAAFFSFEDEAAGILRTTELPLAGGFAQPALWFAHLCLCSDEVDAILHKP